MNPNESRKWYELPTHEVKRRASVGQAGTSPTKGFGVFGGGQQPSGHPMEHQFKLQQQYHERRMSGGSATAKKW